MRIIRLNQTGITHWIIPVVVMLMVGGIGVYTVTKSRAATIITKGNCSVSITPNMIAAGKTASVKVTVRNTGTKAFTPVLTTKQQFIKNGVAMTNTTGKINYFASVPAGGSRSITFGQSIPSNYDSVILSYSSSVPGFKCNASLKRI